MRVAWDRLTATHHVKRIMRLVASDGQGLFGPNNIPYRIAVVLFVNTNGQKMACLPT